MIIYSEFCTPRLEYTLNLVFSRILGLGYSIITSFDITQNESELLINYSNSDIKNSVKILPSGLLSENFLKQHDKKNGNFEGLPTIYHSGKGDIPFDIFSAIFYMVSRYEEYLPFEGDVHGRFRAEESLAYKYGFHRLPVVELWCKLLADKLGIAFPDQPVKVLPTIDIDNAWKYKNKGFFRTVGGIFKSLLKMDLSSLREKIAVISGKMSDPADNYAYLEEIGSKTDCTVQYFILAGSRGKNDRAIPIGNKQFRKLLVRLNQKKSVGLHPSYRSFGSEKELEKEYLSLCSVFTNKITKSRQHYLLLKFPGTYRNLIKLGIREDYSIGWGSQAGFRAGISRPFPFYDLLAEKQTHLMLVPFVAMDRTLKDYMKLTPDEAISLLDQLKEYTKQIGGWFVLLWHNDSIGDTGEWKGWRPVFEKSLGYGEIN
ncbi:MAG: polysaccharide deacetylase family protein [Bacteroidales bacterium]|nr:polysaccharide deacetylase family protein [Bacteroidales bacterium]